MKYTVFLDRDGVINNDSSAYIKTQSEFTFIDKSPEAIALLNRSEFDVIVITNQSAIARKLTTFEELEKIFTKMKSGVKNVGGYIKDVFYCPHLPDAGCDCRKPEPGMIFQAQKKYKIDLQFSCMIGDSVKDIECAKNAGCGLSVLVKTGNGKKAEKLLAAKGINPDFVANNLFEAVLWLTTPGIIQNSG
ncbi:MAG: D-glycero-beta-D-manno-heptose 1,7-bisphosphate 7-phosphatase [Desulfobacteraceae bacterium]|nr:D-glycero-beta-D-manno-heptose 1,7-bisphosphate 7-phosphatase [Desulfobacteraceae bacterium]